MADFQTRSSIKLTIVKKQLLAGVLNLFLMVMVGSYAVRLMSLISIEIEEVAEIDQPLMKSVTQIELHSLEQETYFEKLLSIMRIWFLSISSELNNVD
ncbi:hypothetical protein Sps_01306 [Shewanella psychrophila]|uniref:Uncharacterized protein n=1 Tax=Shewanella psychrophila TaxID=225848 RepID=A0A1S6HLU5_9GAMM|nr:hypothetical protein [Shewanella psychrophila]AQS36474.1 hypothetical protein Sps_01306 [Shewanella psychrophila]